MAKRIAEKVLLVGWDAADWQMIRPVMDTGWMPTLADLMERGTSGNLATIQPALSPMLWNSIATGKRADKHGICGFVEPCPDRSGIRPVSSTSRKCKALWNILSQNGLRSNVVSWFASHPAEPIHGAIVTDRYAAQCTMSGQRGAVPDGAVHPAQLGEHLQQLLVTPAHLDAQALLPFVPHAAEIDQDKDDRLVKLASLVAQASTVQAAACHLARTQPWDFMAVYFSAIDQFGHFFMPYHPPKLDGVSEADARIFGDVMTGCYRFHDMMLEALLALAGDDTTVLLVSDHGFLSGAQRPGADAWEQPEQWHRSFGVAVASGPGIRKGEALYGATLLDVTPTILALFGLPIGADMDGRPWLEIFTERAAAGRVPTWDDIAGEDGMHPETAREDPAESAEMIRRLVDLGYIDAPSDDVEATLRKTVRDQKINLAMALAGSRRAADAIGLWRELAEEYPDEEGFKVQLALALVRLGWRDDGLEVIDSMSEPVRNSVVVQLVLAALEMDRKNVQQAVDRVEQALTQRPKTRLILNQAADIFLRANELDKAEAAFREALAVTEDNPVAHEGLARICLRRDDPAKAVEHALLAVGLTHFFPAAHFALAQGLERIGRGRDAVAAYETALGMGYRRIECHRRLAELLRQIDPEKAQQHEWAAEGFVP
jgi:tetratricopeptide (TPR) repeat protein